MSENSTDTRRNKKKKAVKIIKLSGFILLCCIFAALLINSLLCIFVKSYYPTYGNYRLFAIVSDSMEPEIPTGHMIVGRVPKSESEIKVGTVITYGLRQGKSVTLITHRVTQIHKNETTGEITYTTRGDNARADDGVHPAFSDVVGIYTGKSCAGLGYIVGFLQSTEGAVALIVITLIFIFAVIMISYVNHVRVWRNSALSALNKIRSVLSCAQVEELKTISDVVGIINKDPESKQELKRKDKKLEWFLITGALPKRPYRDDLCPTDEMSSNIEEKIPYLCYRYPQDAEQTDDTAEFTNTDAAYDNQTSDFYNAGYDGGFTDFNYDTECDGEPANYDADSAFEEELKEYADGYDEK